MLNSDLFSITSTEEFTQVSLEVFRFQHENNKVYRQFCDYLHIQPAEVKEITAIPFLPIQFFKSHKVLSTNEKPQAIFSSSGTTGTTTSKHYVTDLEIYTKSFTRGFAQFYGAVEDYVVLALLPSYLERKGSSLIAMVQDFITRSKHVESGFYLHNHEELAEKLKILDAAGKKVLLIGVSFALLDLVEKYQFALKNTIVMETGGMKGRRKEMIRAALHKVLKAGFGVEYIHSEYGMTELLSQAYSKGNGIFHCPNHMKLLVRDPEEPMRILPSHRNGGLNVIDLANINSCAFIATQDIGRQVGKNAFEIAGRFDHSDVRGCNLLLV